MGGDGAPKRRPCKYTTIILAFAPNNCTLNSYDLKSGLEETLNWSTKPTIEQLKNLIKDGGYLRFDKNLKSIMKEIEEKLKNEKKQETLDYLTMPCIPKGTTKFHLDTPENDVYDDFDPVDQQEKRYRDISPCTFVLWWKQKFLPWNNEGSIEHSKIIARHIIGIIEQKLSGKKETVPHYMQPKKYKKKVAAREAAERKTEEEKMIKKKKNLI